jgi:hypothetical protein
MPEQIVVWTLDGAHLARRARVVFKRHPGVEAADGWMTSLDAAVDHRDFDARPGRSRPRPLSGDRGGQRARDGGK